MTIKFIKYEFILFSMKEDRFVSKIVRVGERGQIVIPKRIRKIEGIKPKSMLKVTNYGTGTIVMSKVRETKSPEEKFFEFLEKMKLPKNAWEEIQKERHIER